MMKKALRYICTIIFLSSNLLQTNAIYEDMRFIRNPDIIESVKIKIEEYREFINHMIKQLPPEIKVNFSDLRPDEEHMEYVADICTGEPNIRVYIVDKTGRAFFEANIGSDPAYERSDNMECWLACQDKASFSKFFEKGGLNGWLIDPTLSPCGVESMVLKGKRYYWSEKEGKLINAAEATLPTEGDYKEILANILDESDYAEDSEGG